MIRRLRHALSRPFRQRLALYNGVVVRDRDVFVPPRHEPTHKQQLATAAIEATEPGDTVVVVGGGRGVVPTILARLRRDVRVYEAAGQMCATLRDTRQLNNVYFTVIHAVVGEAGETYGSTDHAKHISDVDDLEGDALVLDCEGAEQSILPAHSWDSIVVETHPEFGATTGDVQAQLEDSRIAGPDEIDGDVVIA